MLPALLGPQCKTQREEDNSKTPGSGAEDACVQEWRMDMGIRSAEDWRSIVFKTPNLNLRMSHNSESLSKLLLLRFTLVKISPQGLKSFTFMYNVPSHYSTFFFKLN